MALLADQNLFPDQIVFNYIKWKETSLTFSQLFFFNFSLDKLYLRNGRKVYRLDF